MLTKRHHTFLVVI